MKSAWPAPLTAGFLNATELADYLVTKGIPLPRSPTTSRVPPWRWLKGRTSRSKPCRLTRFRACAIASAPDVFDVLEYRAAVARRNAPGGTGPLSVARQLEKMKAWLHEIQVDFCPQMEKKVTPRRNRPGHIFLPSNRSETQSSHTELSSFSVNPH